MDSFWNKDGKPILLNMIRVVQENRDYLSEIDGAIGDGDHGINMSKGFALCEKEILTRDIGFSEGLCVLGDVLFNHIGGSMGPIYGLLFAEMGAHTRNMERIDGPSFHSMLQSGIGALLEIITAEVGDKTLMDALVPAASAFEMALEQGGSFSVALDAMQQAAIRGKEETKGMIAKHGRASRLGERSRGVIDAGAASCSLILSAMADTIRDMI